MKKRVEGFTLTELLVVLAVTAALGAVLLPAFAGARGDARAAACANNLRRIGVALNMYAEDWDDFYISTRGSSGTSTENTQAQNWYIEFSNPEWTGSPRTSQLWSGMIYELGYVPAWSVYYCPSETPHQYSHGDAGGSYGMSDFSSGWGMSFFRRTDIPDPDGAFLVSDTRLRDPDRPNFEVRGSGDPETIAAWGHPDRRHDGAWNMAFASGRAGPVPGEDAGNAVDFPRLWGDRPERH